MAFLWGRSKNRSDVVKTAKEHLSRLLTSPQTSKAEEEVAKSLAQLKALLQGTESEIAPEQVGQLVTSMVQEDLLFLLSKSVHLLPFEARKDTQTIFSCVLRFRPANSTSQPPLVIAYIVNSRPEIINQLCRGYEYKDSAMPCGAILREALRNEDVAFLILYDEPGIKFRLEDVNETARASGQGLFWDFFTWIDRGAFEVSTDAFTTFRDVMTKHKQVVAQYLAVNFDEFFHRYNNDLVGSGSYVTKRQSIKLLGEILLDRANYNVMMAYVDSGDHLKLCMNLLKDDRKMVQYEGFHVFKVFVANPHKSVPVQKILINNREKLLKFLPGFLGDRTDDDQFIDEKSFLIRQIEMLPPTPVEPPRQ